MANERLVEKFMRELMREFILLCHGNDFEKLTLLKIGDTVERLYEKYGSVDAVPVVRCKDCKHYKSYGTGLDGFESFGKCLYINMDVDMPVGGYCCYGERRNPNG